MQFFSLPTTDKSHFKLQRILSSSKGRFGLLPLRFGPRVGVIGGRSNLQAGEV